MPLLPGSDELDAAGNVEDDASGEFGGNDEPAAGCAVEGCAYGTEACPGAIGNDGLPESAGFAAGGVSFLNIPLTRSNRLSFFFEPPSP